jgi:hypothetical protein
MLHSRLAVKPAVYENWVEALKARGYTAKSSKCDLLEAAATHTECQAVVTLYQRTEVPIALIRLSVNSNTDNCNRLPRYSASLYPVVGNENGILIVYSASGPHATAELSCQHTSRLDNGKAEMVRTLT